MSGHSKWSTIKHKKAAADAKRHHKRHARHHLVKKSRAVLKSAGRVEQGGLSEPSEPSHEEPAPSDDPPSGGEPGASEPDPIEPDEPNPTPPPGDQPSSDAGVVVSYGEGVLNIELMTDGHVVGKVIPGGTQFSCRSASTHETVTEGCNASLLHAGQHVHEFTVNYGPEGAWFQRIIIVLP
jgi:hypothetical protein